MIVGGPVASAQSSGLRAMPRARPSVSRAETSAVAERSSQTSNPWRGVIARKGRKATKKAGGLATVLEKLAWPNSRSSKPVSTRPS